MLERHVTAQNTRFGIPPTATREETGDESQFKMFGKLVDLALVVSLPGLVAFSIFELDNTRAGLFESSQSDQLLWVYVLVVVIVNLHVLLYILIEKCTIPRTRGNYVEISEPHYYSCVPRVALLVLRCGGVVMLGLGALLTRPEHPGNLFVAAAANTCVITPMLWRVIFVYQ